MYSIIYIYHFLTYYNANDTFVLTLIMNFEKILSARDDDQDEPPTGFFGNVFGHLLKEKQKEAAASLVSTKQSESDTQNKTEQLLSYNNAVVGNNENTAASSTVATFTNLPI